MSNPSYDRKTREILQIGLELLRSGKLDDAEIASLIQDVSKEALQEALPDIEKLLDHPSALVRINSLDALGFTFGKTGRVERVMNMLQCDPDEDVRSSAAITLANVVTSETREMIRNVLVSVVRDISENEDVRMAAYDGLLSLEQIPYGSRPDSVTRSLSEIDWKSVH